MDLLVIAVVVVVVAVAAAVVGIRVGMLAAPRIERWGTPRDPDSEDTGDA
jgi:hypothetical protein